VDHEPGRWSRGARGWQHSPSRAERGGPDGATAAPQQLHLVSQGYPVRIRRALLAGALALALAVGGALAASEGGSAVPTSEQSGGVTTTVPEGS
jgi:hypothetical protein